MPKCPVEEISKDEIRWFANYWMSKCRDRAVPRRDDMAPEDLAKLWPHLMIIDRVDGEYRIRLMGTEVAERYGQDLTGKKTAEAGFGDSEAYWISIYDEVFAGKKPVFGRDSFYWQDREYVKYEWVGVPLADDGVTVNQLMGCVIFTT